MHVLTKTLVVLAAVFSVALSALVIAYAVNTDRIAADYGNERRIRTAAEAAAANNLSSYNAEKVQLQATVASLNNELLKARQSTDSLASEVATLRTEKTKAESERQSIINKIAELGETTKTQAQLITNYREETRTLRDADLLSRNRQAELDDRINDLESQREVLDQNYRALQEQIAEAKRAQEQGASTPGSAGGSRTGSAGAITPSLDVKGRVEAVQYDDVLKKTIVKINLGSNDRVSKNMAFHIVRGSTYVGRIQITHEPDLKYAVGEVVLTSEGQQVRVGDEVAGQL